MDASTSIKRQLHLTEYLFQLILFQGLLLDLRQPFHGETPGKAVVAVRLFLTAQKIYLPVVGQKLLFVRNLIAKFSKVRFFRL